MPKPFTVQHDEAVAPTIRVNVVMEPDHEEHVTHTVSARHREDKRPLFGGKTVSQSTPSGRGENQEADSKRAGLRDGQPESLTTALRSIASELRSLRALFDNRINESPFLNIEAAAAYLCIPPATLRRYAERERLLDYHVLGQGHWVFRKEDLIKFMQRFRRPGIDG